MAQSGGPSITARIRLEGAQQVNQQLQALGQAGQQAANSIGNAVQATNSIGQRWARALSAPEQPEDFGAIGTVFVYRGNSSTGVITDVLDQGRLIRLFRPRRPFARSTPIVFRIL